jgi:hypothetical protein
VPDIHNVGIVVNPESARAADDGPLGLVSNIGVLRSLKMRQAASARAHTTSLISAVYVTETNRVPWPTSC